jgi:hypothetical protein
MKTLTYGFGKLKDHKYHYISKVSGMDFDEGVCYVFIGLKQPDGTRRFGWKKAGILDLIWSYWRIYDR